MENIGSSASGCEILKHRVTALTTREKLTTIKRGNRKRFQTEKDKRGRSSESPIGQKVLCIPKTPALLNHFRRIIAIIFGYFPWAWHGWITCHIYLVFLTTVGFPGGSDGKESACDAGDLGPIPGSERSPGEGNGYPLQYSWVVNPMDRGAWRATVHGVTQSWTRLSN